MYLYSIEGSTENNYTPSPWRHERGHWCDVGYKTVASVSNFGLSFDICPSKHARRRCPFLLQV